jgi:predicted metal-dependent phosphotriesterase family hydrolase
MVGTDAAKRAYWRCYGGTPGLAWLFSELPRLLREVGLDNAALHHIYVQNPARAFAFNIP